MKRFKSVLAVYGDSPGSDDVLIQASALARANGAMLTIVNPQERPQTTENIEEARRRLMRIVPWVAQQGVANVATDVLVGTPHVEIVQKVVADNHDLVIVSTEGGRMLKDVFQGNTAINLMLKCPCTVWLLRPGQSMPCYNVMAAINPRPEEPCGSHLDEKILDLALSVARANDACLHVVQFWEVEGREGETIKSELPPETRRKIIDKHENMRRQSLGRLLSRFSMSQDAYEIHLPRGRPELNIANTANQLATDLVVMGAACRVGISRFLMGNLVESVLNGVRCSVLAVKPDGIRAPAMPQPVTAARELLRARALIDYG